MILPTNTIGTSSTVGTMVGVAVGDFGVGVRVAVGDISGGVQVSVGTMDTGVVDLIVAVGAGEVAVGEAGVVAVA